MTAKKQQKKTHFIFDMDDTLTDSYSNNQQLFVDTSIPYLELKPEVEKFLRDLHFRSRGTSMLVQFTEAVKHFCLSINPQVLVDANERDHAQKSHQVKIFDAAGELIKYIKSSGRKVSVCTNRQTTSLNKIIDYSQLTDYFSFVVSCTDAGHEKPDPYCLLDIVNKSGESKSNFIYFGDSKTDYEFANNAGIDFIIIDHYLNKKNFYKMILESFL